jgi:hypothetical protein
MYRVLQEGLKRRATLDAFSDTLIHKKETRLAFVRGDLLIFCRGTSLMHFCPRSQARANNEEPVLFCSLPEQLSATYRRIHLDSLQPHNNKQLEHSIIIKVSNQEEV